MALPVRTDLSETVSLSLSDHMPFGVAEEYAPNVPRHQLRRLDLVEYRRDHKDVKEEIIPEYVRIERQMHYDMLHDLLGALILRVASAHPEKYDPQRAKLYQK